MFKDIQACMHAFIVQHGSALVVLVAFQQHPEVQQNDEQTNSLENHVPHINCSSRIQSRHIKICT
jgi:hypothetical protein